MGYQHIVAAYDGSEPAKKALDAALELAHMQSEAKLEVIHIYHPNIFVVGEGLITSTAEVEQEHYDASESIVEKAKLAVRDYPNASVVFKEGAPDIAIVDHAHETQADLIVIGSRGLGGIREFMLGSVSHYVVQHANIPVLVVK